MFIYLFFLYISTVVYSSINIRKIKLIAHYIYIDFSLSLVEKLSSNLIYKQVENSQYTQCVFKQQNGIDDVKTFTMFSHIGKSHVLCMTSSLIL